MWPRLVALRLAVPWVLLLLAVIARDPVVDLLARLTSSGDFVATTVYLYSTRYERFAVLLAFLAVCLALSGLIGLRRSRPSAWTSALTSVAVGAAAAALMVAAGQPHALPAACLLAAVFLLNCLPTSMAAGRSTWGRIADVAFLLSIGVSEMLLPRQFAAWASARAFGRVETTARTGLSQVLPGAIVVSTVLALLLPYQSLTRLSGRWFADRDVERVPGDASGGSAPADLAWVAFDTARQQLYLCGNGTDVLLVFTPTTGFRRTTIGTGGAQFCGFIPSRGEVLVYNRIPGTLTWVDGATLAASRQVELGSIAVEGAEVYVGYDAFDDAVFLICEADLGEGVEPGIVVDATTGRVRGRFRQGDNPGAIGNIAMHPNKGLAYFGFFAGPAGLVKFDISTLTVATRTASDSRVDRLTVDADRNELLVASPIHSRVVIHDADSLTRKGEMATVFGARGLAIDHARGLLLVTSFLSNELDVIDLKTRTSVARFWLGPWLRDVAIDEPSGIAYVTSRHGLYRVRYAARVKGTRSP